MHFTRRVHHEEREDRSNEATTPDASPAASGQSLVEFAIILPLVLLIVLGVVEVGYALLDQHVVTKLTREGSNLISRDTTLQDAATAMRQHRAAVR